MSRNLIAYFETREEVDELLKLDSLIDLVIPRGVMDINPAFILLFLTTLILVEWLICFDV